MTKADTKTKLTPTCMECETPMVVRKRGGYIVVVCTSCGFSEVVI